MAFTSFRDTLERMRNDLASGNWRVKSYDIDGMQREFFSPAEFMQMLDYVERKAADEACNQALNATAAQMLLAFNLLDLRDFGPILENVVTKGLPEIQREILFLHIREKKKKRPEPEDLR